jgi:hypothetical protein
MTADTVGRTTDRVAAVESGSLTRTGGRRSCMAHLKR